MIPFYRIEEKCSADGDDAEIPYSEFAKDRSDDRVCSESHCGKCEDSNDKDDTVCHPYMIGDETQHISLQIHPSGHAAPQEIFQHPDQWHTFMKDYISIVRLDFKQ